MLWPLGEKELFNLRLGQLVHQDLLHALTTNQRIDVLEDEGLICLSEVPVEIDELNVRGSLDLMYVLNNMFDIFDLKTTHSFMWRRKFGLKKNRESEPSPKYPYQLATYAIGVKRRFGWKPKNMEIIYYKKDDSLMKSENVPLGMIDEAKEYWSLTNDLCERHSTNHMVPGETTLCPVESWECNYCPFFYLCDSPFVSEKKKKEVLDA